MLLQEDNKNQELENKEEEVAVVTPKKKRKSPKKAAAPKVEEPKVEAPAEEEDDFDKIVELIPEWKKQYKKIFKNEFDGEIIIWRRLKRKEYKDILMQEVEDEDGRILSRQEKMVEVALLYPFDAKNLIEENAGLATVLSDEILAKSGFALSFTEEL